MALLFSDGFDLYTTTASGSGGYSIRDTFTGFVNGAANISFSTGAGHSSGDPNGRVMTIGPVVNGTANGTPRYTPIPVTLPGRSFCIGAYIKVGSSGLSNDTPIFQAASSAGLEFNVSAGNSSSDPWQLVLGPVNTGSIFNLTSFYFIEWISQQRTDNPNNCDFFVYVNGNLTLQQLNVSTFTSGSQTWSAIRLCPGVNIQLSGTTRPITYDNLYVTDGNRLGPINIRVLVPTADTAQKDWTPISGTSNFNMVNTGTFSGRGNMSYDPGEEDLYDLTSYTLAAGHQILQVDAVGIFNLTGVGNSQCRVNMRLNSTTYNGDTASPTSSNVNVQSRITMTENPITSQRWSQIDINNLFIGPERL